MDGGIDATRRDDQSLAGDDLGARADHDVHAGLDVGIPGLAELRDLSVLDRDVALDDAPPVDHQRIGDHRVGAILRLALALSHAVADHLAAAELHFLAVDSEIALDFDDEVGVGETDAISGRRPEHFGVGAATDFHRALRVRALFFAAGFAGFRSSGPITAPRKPLTMRSPPSATSSTVRFCPGSKRTAVPAAMLRRKPRAAARSKASASLVSAKW